MTRDAAVDLLMSRLGKRTDTVTKDSIIAEMSFVQAQILEQAPDLPWFLVIPSTSLATVASTVELALPADFLRPWADGRLWLTDTSGGVTALVRDDWDTIVENVDAGTGQPKYFDIVGLSFYFRITPDQSYALTFYYYARDVDINGTYGDAKATTENNWLKYAADLLIAETGIIIANQYLQSQTMQARFETQAGIARNRLIAQNTAMEEAMKQRFMEG